MRILAPAAHGDPNQQPRITRETGRAHERIDELVAALDHASQEITALVR
jgi:hypothetical protein